MDIAIGIMGGLGLFLYGMTLMGDGLQKAAGSKLKRIIELLTSNVIMGVLVGMVVTMVIQSSISVPLTFVVNLVWWYRILLTFSCLKSFVFSINIE